MILVGNSRGGARDLARHLMKDENERVELYELRGFVADDLDGALQESYAISRGTQCKKHLLSVSFNPPKGAEVSNEQFVEAIEKVEIKLGMTGQPRAIVFHEKYSDDGQLRRHAHAVWSRINSEEMKAIQLPHSKLKMQDVSRDLYLEHGWQMPRGLSVSGARDPLNYSLAEWQQAKRIKKDPREIKVAFQDAWAISDSKTAFSHALKERGYKLCRGDRRAFVAVDVHGEVHNIAKRVGIKTKEVRERLGDMDTLMSLAEAKTQIARDMQAKMTAFKQEVTEKEKREQIEIQAKKVEMKERQKGQREAFLEAARLRRQAEEEERQKRLRTGLPGLWDRFTGKRKKTLAENAVEAEKSKKRDLEERKALVDKQKADRRHVLMERANQRHENKAVTRSLSEDAKVFQNMENDAELAKEAEKEAFKEKRRNQNRRPRRSRNRDGPEPEI